MPAKSTKRKTTEVASASEAPATPAVRPKSQRTRRGRFHLHMVHVLLVVALAVGFMGYGLSLVALDLGQDINDKLGVNTISAVIIDAMEDINQRAPIDPATGDQYMPETGWYLPVTDDAPRLRYNYTPTGYYDNWQEAEIVWITSDQIMSPQIALLRSAATTEQLFERLPKAQACNRGVLLSSEELGDDYDDAAEYKTTITLADDSVVYAYAEPACSELDELIPHFETLTPYKQNS